MKIHQYERLWLVGAMVLIVGFILTITYGSVGLGISMVDDEADALAPGDIGEDERFEEPRVEQVGENQYEVYVVAMTFIFQPDPIEIPAESEVTFYVTSQDVIHSFTVVGTNTNTMVIPGEVSTLTVEFDDPGEYGVICNEYCGSGHHDMEAQLFVLEDGEFDLTELEVEADEAVALDEEIELTATVENRQFDSIEETVTIEIGEESFEETISIDGEESENVTVTVDADDLEGDDHDWAVEVTDESESGTVTVGEEDGTDTDGEHDAGGDGDG
ncbi:cytochrome c oxidase subunit II [Natronobacterium gregoryi]|uniref:Cytochrome C oxidase subunit II n=2 Tax=Natronobacterium gregoryi TaxID=44930 RepID=L0ABN7_NATGS|nr:cytochrome c oxidase subunit II [Natronobacterium gregoryi]AFZ71313.1 heme/copper-type cytochrome/quinol oxidases, subunit 2 [Natronobacterium gregoryi SP2]ELY67202.1 cytochrome c oxidase subunit II [Natronobacterium gregoryi SP2]PLK19183.1 cytochrome C oxidase subunit II [Natronobacterium gregoryi SP2]SFJ58924.1 cytochrome c oxidase subunit 2 [Natronobacterium gregoryi]